MCGIAGIIDLEGLSDADRQAVGAMVQTLRHRGPDDLGTHLDPHAALGHARLSIIDLTAAGRQPLSNEDGAIWLTYNGEIYNFEELRTELAAKGHRFRTQTDSETIVHLYEEEGPQCVERLRGMFAFAIWDQTRRQVFLARDRLGIKPLYYGVQGRRLVFGSEIKALLPADRMRGEIDLEALHDYLTFHWIPAPKSIFRGIRKLPPGHAAVFDAHGFRLREYWDVSFAEEVDADEPALIERFRAQLAEAVRMRLVADVPLGAFLSGGLDSSAVVATMAGLRPDRVLTNSIGFDEHDHNELDYANRVAARFHTDHHCRVVRPDAVDVVSRLAWHWDEPFADPSAIPTFYLSQMARENVTVALSGDGGDENLAGYRRYKLHSRQNCVRQCLPDALRRMLFGSLGRLYPKADWLPRPLRAQATFQQLALSPAEAVYHSRAAVAPARLRKLLRPEVRSALGDYSPQSVIEHHYGRCDSADPLHREMYVDLKSYLADDILTKVDRASMAVGLEVRVPILDHRLVEFLASVPSHMKLRRGQGKYLFKQAFRPQLGPEIVDRRKMGFSVPLGAWFRGPLREMVEDTLFSPTAAVGEWLDVGELRRLWNAHRRGLRQMDTVIWAALMLEHWAQNFRRAPAVRTTVSRPSVPLHYA